MATTPAAAARLLDSLQTDLRALSNEAKRKYPPVKEAAEAGILKIKTLMAKNKDIIPALVACSGEILQPFLLGCDTKNIKIVQICLVSVQKLISYEALSEVAARNVVNMLWSMMESGIEEVKVLQTLLVLLTTSHIVRGDILAKAIVICFRLHFFKDTTTSNTASATVRQVVTIVFERVLNEDETLKDSERPEVDMESQKAGSKAAPPSLYSSATDAYLLFQDLCYLVNADQPYWLVGMTEMTRTFGLELLESVLNSFPQVFLKHEEFKFLLKERVCPLVIKLFSPSIKYRQGLPNPPSPSPVEKPYFPISMRLLRVVSVLIQLYYSVLITECEIFLSLLVKFLDGDKPMWQRALAMEVLNKICVKSQLLRSFCENYDMKEHASKVFRDIVNGLGSFIQSMFVSPVPDRSVSQAVTGSVTPVQHPSSSGQAMMGNLHVGGGVTPQPAFVYRGIWIPLVQVSPLTSAKPTYLEMLEKTDPPICTIQDGYALSVAFNCLLDIVKGVSTIITTELEIEQAKQVQNESERQDSHDTQIDLVSRCDPELSELWECLINSSWCGVLPSLSLLLDASTDETATESILKSVQVYASLCGKLNLNTPRDAFITSLCKASLPPHYALTVLNIQTTSTSAAKDRGHRRTSSRDNMLMGYAEGGMSENADGRNQVVAVGSPLPTVLGTQQGPVMLTAKNLQCMRAILSVAHCHGGILGTAWHLVLSTLQHLTWILGLKPASGGSLKVGGAADGPNAVITTAVMAELPVLSAMLSRLFESSQYLDDVALHHLVDALCKLSSESMELAYANREPSLFAIAKLLETGLVNLPRIEILWSPVTGHLLEVCQHPHLRMREWGAEAVTALIKAAMAYKYKPQLHENLRLQTMLLSPLQELSAVPHADIRQKQLECVLQVIQDSGETLEHGWPLILQVIGSVTEDQGENLIRVAFQSLQLVVNDFLPMMPCQYLQVCIEVASKFGLQSQELNISLTSVGLLWNIADYLYQNRNKIKVSLVKDTEYLPTNGEGGIKVSQVPPSDVLWLCLYSKLADLCVDQRPAIRKSAGQTLFSTISAHGSLLEQPTWQTVLWQVLFPLLDRVQKCSGDASTVKSESTTGNILIHHSRDTAEKQWAETRVLSLAGVARVFNTWRHALKHLGDYPRAWALLLEYIEAAALSNSSEVSLAALNSFQEILQIQSTESRGSGKDGIDGHGTGNGESKSRQVSENRTSATSNSTGDTTIDDIALWSNAWRVWHNIGIQLTNPADSNKMQFIPCQAFLTALVQIFPPLFEYIKPRFVSADLQKLCIVLRSAVSVPVSAESSPFIVPSFVESKITALQDAVLNAIHVVQKAISDGAESMQTMYPMIFHQLLTFVSFACQSPNYRNLNTKSSVSQATISKQERWANFRHSNSSQPEWVSMNYVPFAEKSLQMVVELYKETATQKSVVEDHVLQNIIKTLQMPLGMKYGCPSQSTWKLSIAALLEILRIALPVARNNSSNSHFMGMWSELAIALEHFLFSQQSTPPTLSIDEFQEHESIDIEVVQLLRDEVLPYPSSFPKPFMASIMSVLNRGSIHSTSTSSFTDTDTGRQLREEFAKACFETLLQFSFITESVITNEGCITKMALSALLTRCQEVLKQYVEDEKLSGKCPLPRPRMSEMSFVLKAVGTLLASLKKAKPGNVDHDTWKQVIALYPNLVDCTTCTSSQVCKNLKEVLHHYHCLLSVPPTAIQNSL